MLGRRVVGLDRMVAEKFDNGGSTEMVAEEEGASVLIPNPVQSQSLILPLNPLSPLTV